MSTSKRSRALLLCALLSLPFMASADFNDALTAYRTQDFSKAVAKARTAAMVGDARGSLLLGILYQNGMGVPANSSTAAGWYEKAAQGGMSKSYANWRSCMRAGTAYPKTRRKP